MVLKLDEKNDILLKLNSHLKKCPVCQHKEFIVDENVYLINKLEGIHDDFRLMRTSKHAIPVIVVTCDNCHYILQFVAQI